MLCRFSSLKCILAFVYIPPNVVLEYQLGHQDVPLYIMGDFNCYLDPAQDKHPPVVTICGSYRTLKRFIDEVGWTDSW